MTFWEFLYVFLVFLTFIASVVWNILSLCLLISIRKTRKKYRK
jgi:hypothetical protein